MADDPQEWWRRTVDAVIAFTRGEREKVADHLRWIEARRGRPIAMQAQKAIRMYAQTDSWANVHMWPSWGYACKPPVIERVDRPKPKRKKR